MDHSRMQCVDLRRLLNEFWYGYLAFRGERIARHVYKSSWPWRRWLTSWHLTGSATHQQCLQVKRQVLPSGQPEIFVLLASALSCVVLLPVSLCIRQTDAEAPLLCLVASRCP